MLVEIGTEELPPKALLSLMTAFGKELESALDDVGLRHGDTRAFASPRRLAVIVEQLASKQEDRTVDMKGPPVKIAFDANGEPTAAATAFAEKCGVGVAELGREVSDKGEWLAFRRPQPGQAAAALLPQLIEQALAALPIPRRMRWGESDVEFVRPVHWVVLLHGDEVIDASVLGVRTGNVSQGHRVHSQGALVVGSADWYLETLESDGHVIADFARRRDMIRDGVRAAAAEAGGHVGGGEALYDEVAALVEWPVPLLGRFDEEYLSLPREVVVSTLAGHQRYFPVADADGSLLPRFITVANIESKDPEQVRDGNERVIRPRLADAAFFWDNDRRQMLGSREDSLREVVYQRGLGSLHDKSKRIAAVAAWLAKAIETDGADVTRAASLAKCDLLTGMVGEFPDLQGIMGRYYALADGEPAAVADAIGEHYRPRFAGDELPATEAGQLLSVADRIDTLAGVFSLGKKPSGNRDPFGLRRAALGVVRILIECHMDIDLKALIAEALKLQPKTQPDADAELAAELYAFITERMRRYFLDRDPGLLPETFAAVMVRQPVSLVDFDRRLAAVQTFARLEQAESLAAANKRIANILRKAGDPEGLKVKKTLFDHDAERALANALQNASDKVAPMLATRSYADALNSLADLKEPVDRFFDEVMVMAEDEAVKNNRLALLGELRSLFLDVADISRLSLG
ncbi:MAG: glycine--tRNA ligase subunit beta [Gammaproteobacteria bacterium]|nr:glycine--tRNA ligase subunit beta [Gammaproteobacteria bacterium]